MAAADELGARCLSVFASAAGSVALSLGSNCLLGLVEEGFNCKPTNSRPSLNGLDSLARLCCTVVIGRRSALSVLLISCGNDGCVWCIGF
jgi:hypothetical protein